MRLLLSLTLVFFFTIHPDPFSLQTNPGLLSPLLFSCLHPHSPSITHCFWSPALLTVLLPSLLSLPVILPYIWATCSLEESQLNPSQASFLSIPGFHSLWTQVHLSLLYFLIHHLHPFFTTQPIANTGTRHLVHDAFCSIHLVSSQTPKLQYLNYPVIC